jgi:alpha-L-fucosidase 2
LHKFPDYPTAESQRGKVFVSVPGEDPEVVYNVPNGVSTIFPGEDHGLHASPEEYEIAVNSYKNHRNEGGNDLVFYHLAGARLGQLDLERFKRQIQYCMLPNGTCTDKVLQSGGRYSDTTAFDFMGAMGIWFENFALPAVINECLMQSYNGILRFFPNWSTEKYTEFSTLRAVGGFLVSAAADLGDILWIDIFSEAGSCLQIYSPWENGVRCIHSRGEEMLQGNIITVDTLKGEHIRLQRA